MTLSLCKRELSKYLNLIVGGECEIELFLENDNRIFEEKYLICIQHGKGYIKANRPRALLIAVYDFLRRLGCRFIRPGKNGEIIPKLTIEQINVNASVIPANKHRGITIEGAVSLENVLDIIEWAPKVGFNSYFIQFRTAFDFFNRWYQHKNNETLPPEDFSEEQSFNFVKTIIQKIKERDMLYHAVGHGWTTACLGMDINGWSDVDDSKIPQEKRELLAEVKGKRGFFKGVPLNTNLCYSNPKVRQLLVDEVIAYIQNHPEIDVLHFWLADDSNNVCECENCQQKRLSDWYVGILNKIDEGLTKRNIKTKICFLVYLDLYWAPQTERIINEDRFILMFAPIFRSYCNPYECISERQELEYKLNMVEYPTNNAPYVTFLKDWQNVFKGDSFDFDYHLMWDINRNFGGETLAEVLYKDIRSLKGLNLNGFLSCQIQRAFYPSGFAFYLMGRALFDGTLSYEDIKKEYYDGAFGKYADFASEIYEKVDGYFPLAFARDEVSLEEAYPLLKKCNQFVENKLNDFPTDSKTVGTSLEILQFMLRNVKNLLEVLLLKAEGASDTLVKQANEKRKQFFNSNELSFQPYADGFYVNMIVDGIVECAKVSIYAN